MVVLDPDALTRPSRRGLVIAGSTGETVLFEHPRAAELPEMLADDPDENELRRRLGPPLDEHLFVDLADLGVLRDTSQGPTTTTRTPHERRVARFTWSRNGLMISGIDTVARSLNRWVTPFVLSTTGRLLLLTLIAAGAVAFAAGRPNLPAVSGTAGWEALAMLGFGLAATIAHELAHAVALVHYGRAPRRAGFGFYWGAVSFFVDSTSALTLNRAQRVTQALVGLGVDVVTTAAFAVLAHFSPTAFLGIVFWRLAVLGAIDIVVNATPVLQVDGHWALADFLDEPDLGPRARRALGGAVRRKLAPGETWLAVYGAVSLVVGVSLMLVCGAVFWAAAGDLVLALFAGSVAEIVLGLYYVGPLVLGLVFSVVGLLLETVLAPPAEPRTEPVK